MTGNKRFKIRHMLVLFFLVYIIYTLVVQQITLMELSHQEEEINNQLKAAIQEREELKRQIQLLHTDSYIEKIARDELGLVKPGEFVYKIEKKPLQ